MEVSGDIARVQALRRAEPGRSWGLVPTMGFLHAGHLALVRRARADNDRVAVSIFVNPAQFNRREDLDSYPRDLRRDLELLRDAGTDLVFTPEPAVMYPPGFQTWVSVEEVSQPLEGASRPGHFRGVATVVAKLFHLLQPTRAYFGQKDAQQTVVLRRMVTDLCMPVELVVCATERAPDGLALSSRNALLSPEQRVAAPVVYRALGRARDALLAGERDAGALRQRLVETVAAEPLARLDYASVADPHTLAELERVATGALLSIAVCFGPVRLIDNILLEHVFREEGQP